jgi:hypothetical protein
MTARELYCPYRKSVRMQGLRDRLSEQIYLFLGLLAFLFSVVLAIVSFVVYGTEMGPHIFATIIGILGEAALVVLVLDRMAKSQQQREWRFVGTIVSHGVTSCMVDLMRLYGIRWGPETFRAHSDRYDEFMQKLRLHLASLQSNLEGLALGAEPAVYEQARKIERRVAWMANYLSDRPSSGARPWRAELGLIRSTMKLAGEFMQATVAAEFRDNLIKAADAMADLGEIESPEKSDAAADRFWELRMDSQGEMLRRNPSIKPEMLHNISSEGLGIFYDVDEELAPFYFAIDFKLIDGINDSAATTSL